MAKIKLWEKGYSINSEIESFITGNDYFFDHILVAADAIASIAHAKTLHKANLLKKKENVFLARTLTEIYCLSHQGKFLIKAEMEDCHTAIELFLSKKGSQTFSAVENPGRKIHLGRSRNDQVQAALRLVYKEFVFKLCSVTLDLVASLLKSAKKYKQIVMPGRTHLQIAMPSSVGLWLASYAEQLLDDLKFLYTSYDTLNKCPLGSAAGYGSSLNLDREYAAKLLGFSSVQNNVLAVQNSRGRLELTLLFALEQIALTLSRFSEDIIIYTLPELGYFSLPDELCSGSSIMPQKKNPDIVELLRSEHSFFAGALTTVQTIVSKLPGGYHRDLQSSKEITLKGLWKSHKEIHAAAVLVQNINVHPERLEAAYTPEIFATDMAYELVKKGLPFRSAYKKIAAQPAIATFHPSWGIKSRCMIGTAGNPNFEYIQNEILTLRQRNSSSKQQFTRALKKLLDDSCPEYEKNNIALSVIPETVLTQILG